MLNLSGVNLAKFLTPEELSRALIITVGNNFRADDGVGPYIASRLKQGPKLSVIDAGCSPEDMIERAVKLSPRAIIFIDAADFGGACGQMRFIDGRHIPENSLSTHSIPLPVISRILYDDTKAKIYYIGIQPKSMEYKEGLSWEVKSSADALIKHINTEFSDA